MKYHKLFLKLKQKLNMLILNNERNHCFNNINLLIFKTILNNIFLIENDSFNRKQILLKIENYLSNQDEIYNEITIFSNKSHLTLLSEQIILEIYKDFGLKQCLDDSLIRQYYLEKQINYNLFFNQVDDESEIQIDYFSLSKNQPNNDFYNDSKHYFILHKIDDLEIRLYDI